MSYIELRAIEKSYDGENLVLKDLSLSIEEGNLVTLIGPSGCGKSTLLRSLAGFESLDRGQIFINGKDVTNLPPGKREIGMVFQQYSLFPNMTVEENIGFGLKMKKHARASIKENTDRIIEIVDLKGKEKKYPKELSGGQKQRVALARAIVNKPKVLLLDEPLSAIDAQLRKSLQKQIRRIQKELNITTIFVTHDQDEAMILSDVIHVMNKGKVEQSGKPTDIYTHPKTHFVASFIGNYNVLSSQEFDQLCGQKNSNNIAIRPEAISASKTSFEADEKRYNLKAKIVDRSTSGNILSYYVNCSGINLRVDELYRSFNLFEIGQEIYISFEKRNCIEV